jgi:hypothetical protein
MTIKCAKCKLLYIVDVLPIVKDNEEVVCAWCMSEFDPTGELVYVKIKK